MSRKINLIVIHCTDSPNGRPQTVTDIDGWHRSRGFMRSNTFRLGAKNTPAFNPELTSIGYHYVIYLDGTVHSGRAPEEIGAHAVGHNSVSLGICLVGQDKFMPRQWAALNLLIRQLQKQYPGATVCGHRDLPGVTKTCPNFAVATWLADNMLPPADHVLNPA